VKAGVVCAHAPAWALARVIALRIHLDDSLTDNGPLRVVPQSHLNGVLTDAEMLRMVSDDGFTECCVRKGGVLAMKPLLVHFSSKTSSPAPRRVLHIEYADTLQLAKGIRLAVA
jgi:ectoine hydroxylase-related dioxygenase (phytanoyl-CoA dioxygenase family)